MNKLQLYIPLRLPSLANTRLHWRALSSLKKKQKDVVGKALLGKVIPPCPLVVTITRIGPRKLDDDNLQTACKYVRDEIARAVGVDDGSDIYTWVYKQVNLGGPHGVVLLIETREF